MAKVAVLCGGPDWPTSVITGILGLPLFEMLYGTLPVVVLIFPVIVAAGFKLEVKHTGAVDDESDADRWFRQASAIALATAAILQCLASLLAAYFAQLIMDDFETHVASRGSSWQQDSQEVEVLVAVAAEERKAEDLRQRLRWALLPFLIRASLLLGTLLASTTVYLVINPWKPAFEKVDIQEKVSELDHLINPAGWCAIGSLFGCLFCLSIFEAWKSFYSVSQGVERPRLASSDIELQAC